MDTQPGAEDEVLSQHETQPVADEAEAASIAPTVADAVAVPGESQAIEATAGLDLDEPTLEAGEDVELSTEELQVSPEAADEQPEIPEIDAEDSAVEDAVLEEPMSVELAPEELVIEELATEEATQPVAADAVAETVEKTATEAAPATFVTEGDFEQLVDEALEAVGGILLFKMRIDDEGEDKHVAAASIGDGARRQFLLLSLPVAGGKLKVETASRSKSPLAKLAEAYVGVVEAFRAAA